LSLHKDHIGSVGVEVEFSSDVAEGDLTWNGDDHLHIFGDIIETKV
jgi:hypothetical protein